MSRQRRRRVQDTGLVEETAQYQEAKEKKKGNKG